MKGSSFKYLIKEGSKNLWNNRVMSFTSIGVLTTCLIIVGVAYLITANVNSMVGYVENQSEMVAFLKNVEKDKIDEIETSLKATPNISSIKFISKEQGLANNKEMLGDDAHLLDDLAGRNPLPDSYTIKVKDLSKTSETVTAIQKIDGVESVLASNDVADTLTFIQSKINTFGTALILALAVISLVIIANTIRATIFTRRKEINIMKYVGATNSFIRIPFIVEGFLLGVISALMAFLIVWGSYTYLTSEFITGGTVWIQAAFQSILPFKSVAPNLFGFFILTGTVLGMMGSGLSIRNHARV